LVVPEAVELSASASVLVPPPVKPVPFGCRSETVEIKERRVERRETRLTEVFGGQERQAEDRRREKMERKQREKNLPR
jgi:hypothetical protein